MMSKPEGIRDDAMGIAVSIEKDIPSRVTGANRVFIRAVIARSIMAAEKRGEEREREACAQLVETFRHFITLTDEEAAETGMLVRSTRRSDLAFAIRKRGGEQP